MLVGNDQEKAQSETVAVLMSTHSLRFGPKITKKVYPYIKVGFKSYLLHGHAYPNESVWTVGSFIHI